jgi:RNA polymerase sigma-70 factor, ECF subfamily
VDLVADFVSAHYDRVVRSVALTTGDPDGAVDSVHDALAALLEREGRGPKVDDVAAWVFVVATNRSRRRFRRDGYLTAANRLLAPLAAPSSAAHDSMHVDVIRALGTLPLRQRQAVVLHYLHDLDVATTARQLGVHEGTVKTALSRARAALADRLPAYQPGEGS